MTCSLYSLRTSDTPANSSPSKPSLSTRWEYATYMSLLRYSRRLCYRLGELVQGDLWYGESRPSGSNVGTKRQLGLVLDFCSLCPRFILSDFLLLSCYYSCVCFTLAVINRQVSCFGYTPREWDRRTLQSMLNGLLYFGL